MTVHTIRQITALQRANTRWTNRQKRQAIARQQRATAPPRPSKLARFLRVCNTVENSSLLWKSFTAAFVIGYIAYFVSHWPHA
ncbi:hypothetical protein PY254_10495 [Rhodanobacter sp. AS-Z3]|uniref:hypothetical protein n=1 Tax=Rhodanobacter sp. AS-Z3 TaxID=3031330 RepID=UPI00247879F3|nr:hypothetical protein [Rhodanobacter sp. AS-Z3]WEN13675.1 hypothetical protein PY254_10495 [Rhodanobacter sp. AS-Z3]